MLRYTFFLFFSMYALFSAAQTYQGPIAKPTSGYGSDGSNTVVNVSVINPIHAQDVQVYYPAGTTSPIPTLFFAHGFSLSSPVSYIGFINFLVSKGYCVVFAPYPISGSNRYDIMEQGFKAAATNLTTIIDTSKVGFIGHSFGAGAIFAIANNLITNDGWGNSGKFLVPIAQWYSYNITQTQLQNFNSSTKLVSIITEDENVTDHRMSIDIFQNINIPNTEKDIVYISTDVVSSYNYNADHYTSLTNSSFDALDYYAIYRLVDALADYTFTGSSTAKNIALGNGSMQQVQMPIGLTNLHVDDNMFPLFPESMYSSPCTNALNPRSSYCSTLSVDNVIAKQDINIYPNPVSDWLTIENKDNNQNIIVFFYNDNSKLISKHIVSENKIDISNLSSGFYFVKIINNDATYVKKIIKI